VSGQSRDASASDFPQQRGRLATRHGLADRIHWALGRAHAAQETAMDTGKTPLATGNQREALKESEQQASQNQPGSFKDKETAEKVLEIAPAGPDKKPIRGLDS
jgi:hypothetical protein